MHVQTDHGAICAVTLSSRKKGFCLSIEGEGPRSPIESWVRAYSQGKQLALPTIFFNKLSTFSKKVYYEMQKVPFGGLISYKELARRVGTPKAARAVGRACAANPFPLFVPCHRVIKSDGSLGGFSCGLDIKKELLLFEKNQIEKI